MSGFRAWPKRCWSCCSRAGWLRDAPESTWAIRGCSRGGGCSTHLLNLGIGRPEIERQLDVIGVTAPDEIVAWFEWHNGFTPDAARPTESEPLSFVYPNSLSGAIVRYRLTSGIGPHWAWAKGWIQLGREPTSLSVDLNGPAREPLRVVRPDEKFMLDELPRDRRSGERRVDCYGCHDSSGCHSPRDCCIGTAIAGVKMIASKNRWGG